MLAPFSFISGGGVANTARTEAFLTATGITDQTIIDALNAMDNSLISAGLLPSGTGAGKIKALYPIVGGTASTHKFNFVDPRDLDEAFRLVFFGGWTHSATGALPNGTNAEANTFLASNNFGQNSFAMGYYSTTNSFAGNSVDMGNSALIALSTYFAAINGDIVNVNNGFINSFQVPPARTNVFFQASRTASNIVRAYFDNTDLGTKSFTSSPTSALQIFLGASNGFNYSLRNCALAYLSDGLTAGEMSNLYTLVQAFQTSLGRQN
jgi:hypothetical protein